MVLPPLIQQATTQKQLNRIPLKITDDQNPLLVT